MPEAWRPIEIPPICERLIGFSVPQDDAILIVSYEGMHLLFLTEPATVKPDDKFAEYDCYDSEQGVANYLGKQWDIIGLYSGTPLLTCPQGEELILDSLGLRLATSKNGVETWSSSFQNSSGDWVAATFSPDGNAIVLGCPCDFDFRVWRRG